MSLHTKEDIEDINIEEGTSLSDWSNEPKLSDLKQDLTDAQYDHDNQVAKIDVWLDNLRIEGKAKPKKKTGKSGVAPKLIRKQAEWRYASLTEPFLSTDDVFNTDPVTFEDKKAAYQNGLVLNNQFNTKLDKVKFFDELVRTVVDEGTAVVRTGWDFQEELQEVEVPIYETRPVFDPQTRTTVMQQVQTGVTLEEQLVTTRNEPTLEICDYRNIVIDPTCDGNLKKAGFIIYSFESNLSTLRKDGKYKNLDKINITDTDPITDENYDSDNVSNFNFNDEPRKKFVVNEYWGFWDIDGSGKVSPIVVAWVGNTIIRMERNPYPDQELPFVSIQYLPVRKSIYGEPDGHLLEDNQKIIGAVTRGMIDIMARSANGQTGYRKDALDLTNKRKYDRGEDYEFNSAVSPLEAFHMHTYSEIPNSAQIMLQIQNFEAESLTGVKSFQSGITGQALGETATGIKSALDATSKRELGILRRIADGLIQLARKIISMNAEFLSEEEIIRVTNEEFIAVRRDDLEGNLDISLTISTAEVDNEKANRLEFMLQTMGNNMDQEMSRIILADIARLRKMPVLAKKIEAYEPPPPDPLQVQLQQLEILKLQKEIAKIESETMENMSDTELNVAKVGTEEAKARNLDSDSDGKDLDYVEQETGTKQERELEKSGAQAESNVTKSLIEHGLRMDEKKLDASLAPKPTTK